MSLSKNILEAEHINFEAETSYSDNISSRHIYMVNYEFYSLFRNGVVFRGFS